MPFETITPDEYRVAERGRVSLVCELHPDYGRKRSYKSRAHHNFWTILMRLVERFGSGHMIATGISDPMKYVERYYLRHIATGRVLCLGTYYSWWRIWADPDDDRGIVELIDLIAKDRRATERSGVVRI